MGLSSFKFLWWARKCVSAAQGRPRSLIDSNIVTLVLHCTVSEMRRLIGWKLRIFLPRSHLTPSLGVNPFEFLDEPFIPKTRVLGLSVGENFVILACVILTQCQRVTDGRTNGRTDGRTDIPVVANTGLCIASYADTLTPCKNHLRSSVCRSVGLSVRVPTFAIFVRFWWNFAQKLGSRKVRKLSFGVKIRWPLPPFCPNFSPHNAFSMGRSEYRSNEARSPIVALKSSNDVPRERLQAESCKML